MALHSINQKEMDMGTNQQPDNQANIPERTDPSRGNQVPGNEPSKEAPGRPPSKPGQPAQPDRDEPGRQPLPGEPGDTPRPSAE